MTRTRGGRAGAFGRPDGGDPLEAKQEARRGAAVVRDLEERFESRVLPLFARRTKEVGALLPALYLHGLAEGDFELALRGLLGEGAPLSKPSIQRLQKAWQTDRSEVPVTEWP